MTARLIAILILLTFAACALLLPARPTPLAVDATPAKATVWTDVWRSPPQFCPSPMPVCQHGQCPAPIPRTA